MITSTKAPFSKTLAPYYHTWFRDCHDSAVICEKRGDTERARQYLADAAKYLEVILDHYDAIEFFSVGKNAFIRDEYLPEEFRGY